MVYHSTVLSMNEKCDFFLLWLVHLISLIYLITSNAWMTKLMIWSNSWLIFRTFRTYVLSFEDSLKTFVSILERQNVPNHSSTLWLNVFDFSFGKIAIERLLIQVRLHSWRGGRGFDPTLLSLREPAITKFISVSQVCKSWDSNPKPQLPRQPLYPYATTTAYHSQWIYVPLMNFFNNSGYCQLLLLGHELHEAEELPYALRNQVRPGLTGRPH